MVLELQCVLAIYNHWTGIVYWTDRLDWWTDTFILLTWLTSPWRVVWKPCSVFSSYIIREQSGSKVSSTILVSFFLQAKSHLHCQFLCEVQQHRVLLPQIFNMQLSLPPPPPLFPLSSPDNYWLFSSNQFVNVVKKAYCQSTSPVHQSSAPVQCTNPIQWT